MPENGRKIGTLVQEILATESEEKKASLLSEFRAKESELKRQKGVPQAEERTWGIPRQSLDMLVGTYPQDTPQDFPEVSKSEAKPEQKGHPFYIWTGLLTKTHMKKIGHCLGTYLWLISKTTSEKDGLGEVLFGHEIPIKRIAKELGFSEKKIWQDLETLANPRHVKPPEKPNPEHAYILKTRGKKGLKIYVMKSKRCFNGAARKARIAQKGESRKLRFAQKGKSGKSYPQGNAFAPQGITKN